MNAEVKATEAKLTESRLITTFLEKRQDAHLDTLQAIDLQLAALQQHMKAVSVPPVNLGTPGAPPAVSDETREILLSCIDDSYDDDSGEDDSDGKDGEEDNLEYDG